MSFEDQWAQHLRARAISAEEEVSLTREEADDLADYLEAQEQSETNKMIDLLTNVVVRYTEGVTSATEALQQDDKSLAAMHLNVTYLDVRDRLSEAGISTEAIDQLFD